MQGTGRVTREESICQAEDGLGCHLEDRPDCHSEDYYFGVHWVVECAGENQAILQYIRKSSTELFTFKSAMPRTQLAGGRH